MSQLVLFFFCAYFCPDKIMAWFRAPTQGETEKMFTLPGTSNTFSLTSDDDVERINQNARTVTITSVRLENIKLPGLDFDVTRFHDVAPLFRVAMTIRDLQRNHHPQAEDKHVLLAGGLRGMATQCIDWRYGMIYDFCGI